MLGEGGCGKVFFTHVDDHPYAIKLIEKRRHNEKYVLKKIGPHPNIVPFIDDFKRGGRQYLVFEVCQRLSKGKYTLEETKQVARHILRALKFIHVDHDLRFGDLKKENVMIFSKHYVLIDFGYCKAEKDARGLGTLDYLAPELVSRRDPKMLKANDIWALGVLIFKLLTDKFPFYSSSQSKTMDNIKHKKITKQHSWKSLDPSTRSFLDYLWRISPGKRPTVKDVINHPWLNSVRSMSLPYD